MENLGLDFFLSFLDASKNNDLLHCTQCSNTEFFLVRIFLYSDLIRTRKNSVFGHFSRGASDQNNEQEPKACSIVNRIWRKAPCEMIDRVLTKAVICRCSSK